MNFQSQTIDIDTEELKSWLEKYPKALMTVHSMEFPHGKELRVIFYNTDENGNTVSFSKGLDPLYYLLKVDK